ncbi:MAG: lactate utilization protein [Planctomycetia bacterium]|nr:lactate utilization protein [Planctomycetia bacterium]
MNREAFLARVREAATSGLRYRVHADPTVTRAMGYSTIEEDLVARFTAEVAKVGGRPVVVPSMEAARREAAQIFRIYEPRSALCWRHPVLDRFGLTDWLRTERVTQIDSALLAPQARAEQRRDMLAADIGITSCTFALAETGSLVMAHEFGNERVASLVPPVYLAIVSREQILADLFDAFDRLGERLAKRDWPSNVTLITGPSKTGDIESKLVVGVHGPGKWHVLVVDETAGEKPAPA